MKRMKKIMALMLAAIMMMLCLSQHLPQKEQQKAHLQ